MIRYLSIRFCLRNILCVLRVPGSMKILMRLLFACLLHRWNFAFPSHERPAPLPIQNKLRAKGLHIGYGDHLSFFVSGMRLSGSGWEDFTVSNAKLPLQAATGIADAYGTCDKVEAIGTLLVKRRSTRRSNKQTNYVQSVL